MLDGIEEIELPDHLFPSPCTLTLAGPSGSGKTTLLMDGILKYRDSMFGPSPVTGVLYFYGEDQPVFQQKRLEQNGLSPLQGGIGFYQGLPSREDFNNMVNQFEGRHFLVILDDLMTEMADSPLGQDIFTKLSHHR